MNIIYLEKCNKAINFDKIYTIEVAKESELLTYSKFEVRAYYGSKDERARPHYEVLAKGFSIPEEAEDYIKAFTEKIKEL